LIDQAAKMAAQFQNGTHNASMEVGVAGEGTLEVTGRIPLPSPSPYLKDLTLGIKGTGMYVPENPTYDASRSDVPQLRYVMGTMRVRADATIHGADDLQKTIGDVQQLSQSVQQTAA